MQIRKWKTDKRIKTELLTNVWNQFEIAKKNLLMESQRKSNIAKKIVIEIGLEFLNLIVGNIYPRSRANPFAW